MAISYCHYILVVKSGNFKLLLISSDQEWQFGSRMPIFTLLPKSRGQEWQFYIATDILVFKKRNFTLLLTSSGQEMQFHIVTDIWCSRLAISHFYCHLVVKNGNFTLLLTSSGQEWQFHTY